MEKGEPLCTLGGNVNWYIHYGKEYESSLKKKKKLQIEPPYNPATPLSKEMKLLSQRDVWTPMFNVALFTMAKTWIQPKCQ